MTKFILAVIILCLFGCATTHVSDVRTLSTQPELKVTSAVIAKSDIPSSVTTTKNYNPKSYHLLYKSYLAPEEKFTDELVTFIYLPKKPTTVKEIKLYHQLCEEWSESVLSFQEASSHYEKNSEKLVPFYWFVKFKYTTPSCDVMIEQYDYARAQQLMRKNKLDTSKAQFIALYSDIRVIMNVSTLTDEEDIVKAFQGWSMYMTKVPDKDDVVYVFNMIDSLEKVLGALEYLVSIKFKG